MELGSRSLSLIITSVTPWSAVLALKRGCRTTAVGRHGMGPPTARITTLNSIGLPSHAGSVSLTLPYPPSVNALWRSGKSRKTGRTFVYPSAAYKAWLAEAHVAWLQQRSKLSVKSIRGWYRITILANPPDRRLRDLGNLEKAVSDFLQSIMVVENDSLAGDIHQKWDLAGTPTNSVAVTVSPLHLAD